mmetsp:Transcript_58937/g.120669  ORF Transcript_58937/g.120669 Transcript_58937/m.120669 type:complete len:86 (+) Transcript_58937:529-786(+)
MGMKRWATAAFIVTMPVLLLLIVAFCLYGCFAKARKKSLSRRISDEDERGEGRPRRKEGGENTPTPLEEETADKVIHVVEIKTSS